MKRSKVRRHGNCIEYNTYCTVYNMYIYCSCLSLPFKIKVTMKWWVYAKAIHFCILSLQFHQGWRHIAIKTNITWTRVSEEEVLFVGNPWHIVNINRTYSKTYRCIADNGVPSPVNSAISVNVLFEYTLYSQIQVSSILFKFSWFM